jgi:hypothetical protein
MRVPRTYGESLVGGVRRHCTAHYGAIQEFSADPKIGRAEALRRAMLRLMNGQSAGLRPSCGRPLRS